MLSERRQTEEVGRNGARGPVQLEGAMNQSERDRAGGNGGRDDGRSSLGLALRHLLLTGSGRQAQNRGSSFQQETRVGGFSRGVFS